MKIKKEDLNFYSFLWSFGVVIKDFKIENGYN